MVSNTPGVIFDMDGVLVASGKAHAASWRIVARRDGIEVTDEQFKVSFGMTSREIIRDWWGEEVSDELILKIDDDKEREYRELITGMVPLTVGIREVLGELQAAGIPGAVGTSGPPENIELVLRETGIGQYFQATVSGKEVARGKPAPDIFLLAAKRIGVQPARCVVVEDAPVGIRAARAAEMKVIGYVGTHLADVLAEAEPHHIVDDLRAITPTLISELINAD